MLRKQNILFLVTLLSFSITNAQVTADTLKVTNDTLIVPETDTVLRITNLNPYFTLHVDSMLSYQLAINRDEKKYYWYLKNSPIGLKVNKDNGLLTFKAEKSFFLSGKLKYDQEYSVRSVKPSDPADKAIPALPCFLQHRNYFTKVKLTVFPPQ
jgi:hypothetical protein